MGVTIRGRYSESPSYDMGYITFFKLRSDIAHTVSEEYGAHYDEMPKACAKIIDVKAYDRRTECLIKKFHCKERFLSFLYQPDVEGKLSPFKCKALLNQIESMDSKRLYGYMAYPKDCMSIGQFRALLRECFDRKVYLEWK